MLEYSEGETRQVQDVRKRYMVNLQRAHVTPERVMFVHAAQAELAAQGPIATMQLIMLHALRSSVLGHRL